MSGKILNDNATVGTLNIKEKDFLVVMVSKVSSSAFSLRDQEKLTAQPKAQPAPAPAPAASTSAPTPAAAAAETTSQPPASTESAPAPVEAPTSQPETAQSGYGGGSFRQ